jgi:hypothetical protein
MTVGAFLPLVAFILVAGSVGVRLLTLWRTTREKPEGLLGLGLLLMSCVAMPLATIGRLPATAGEPVGKLFFAAGIFAVASGVLLIVSFTREVFRPRSVLATVGLGAASVLVTLAAGWMSWANYTGANLEEIVVLMRPGSLCLMAVLGLCFLWSSTESFAYYAPMRRRMALGLADPVVANRFVLWGLAAGGNVALIVVIMWCMHLNMVIFREPIPMAVIAVIGLVMSSAWFLTFFPPERYERFIRNRAVRV